MLSLNTKQIFIQQTQPAALPAVPVQFVKPLSYEFRVAEIMEDEKIVSVKLQVQIMEHDEYGTGITRVYWQDVPRVKMNKDGAILP